VDGESTQTLKWYSGLRGSFLIGSSMDRIPEPELMDDPVQARACAQADFSESHYSFVRLFRERLPGHAPRRVLDLGCGPADVTIRFARAFPECRLTGVDGAGAMVDLARIAVGAAGLGDRIDFVRAQLPQISRPACGADTVISNSLLHHLADPMILWSTVRTTTAPGAAVFVMDLMRPLTRGRAERVMERYAADEPEIQRRDFLNSLCAAFRPEEVRAQLKVARLPLTVETVSDRHMAIFGRIG
jgi:SAM-dependent methyltransferase